MSIFRNVENIIGPGVPAFAPVMDRCYRFFGNGGGGFVLNLPAAANVRGRRFRVIIRNMTDALTINAAVGDLIYGLTNTSAGVASTIIAVPSALSGPYIFDIESVGNNSWWVTIAPRPDVSAWAWGNSTMPNGAASYFLFPFFSAATASTADAPFYAPFSCAIDRLYIRHNVPAANPVNINYTLFVNGLATALSVVVSSTALTGSNLASIVSVAQGDLVSLNANKLAGGAGTSPTAILASVRVRS